MFTRNRAFSRTEATVYGPADPYIVDIIEITIRNVRSFRDPDKHTTHSLYDSMQGVVDSLVKKAERGAELNKDTLAKSSVVDQLVRDAIRYNQIEDHRGDDEGTFDRITTATRKMAKDLIADTILSKVEDNLRFKSQNKSEARVDERLEGPASKELARALDDLCAKYADSDIETVEDLGRVIKGIEKGALKLGCTLHMQKVDGSRRFEEETVAQFLASGLSRFLEDEDDAFAVTYIDGAEPGDHYMLTINNDKEDRIDTLANFVFIQGRGKSEARVDERLDGHASKELARALDDICHAVSEVGYESVGALGKSLRKIEDGASKLGCNFYLQKVDSGTVYRKQTVDQFLNSGIERFLEDPDTFFDITFTGGEPGDQFMLTINDYDGHMEAFADFVFIPKDADESHCIGCRRSR